MILLRTNKTGAECRFTFTFPVWLCQPHIHSNYTLRTHVEKIYSACVEWLPAKKYINAAPAHKLLLDIWSSTAPQPLAPK